MQYFDELAVVAVPHASALKLLILPQEVSATINNNL